MRKASLSVALVALLVLSATVGFAGTRDADARAMTGRTIWVYRSSFTPSMMYAASGTIITLVNQDTVSHRIVLYRGYTPTSFGVTLSPGEWYTSSEPLTCRGSCSTVNYTYRDADRSYVDPTGYCSSFCARLYVYNNGT